MRHSRQPEVHPGRVVRQQRAWNRWLRRPVVVLAPLTILVVVAVAVLIVHPISL